MNALAASRYPFPESVWVVFRGGLNEIFDPGGITLLLLFLIVLFLANRLEVLGKTVRYFLLTVVFLKILILPGLLDFLLAWKSFPFFWDICYLLIIGSFLLLGLILFRDWVVFLKEEKFTSLKIQPPQKSSQTRPLPFWGAGLVVFLATLAVVIQVSWPPDAEATYRVLSSIEHRDWGRAALLLVLYGGVFVLPLAALYKGWQALVSTPPDGWIYRHWSKCLVICSAVFIGYGLSMLSYFIPF